MKYLKNINEDDARRQEQEALKQKKQQDRQDRVDRRDEIIDMDLDRLNYELEKIDDWTELQKRYEEEAKSETEKREILEAFQKRINILKHIIGKTRKLSDASDMRYDILSMEDELKEAEDLFSELLSNFKDKYGEL